MRPGWIVQHTPNERALLATASLVVITTGLVVRPMSAVWAAAVWLGGLVITGAPIVWRTVLETRRGSWATDVVAVLAIIGAVILREPLAGLVIVLMRSGGEALEQHAAGRASAALRELEDAAPRIAHRLIDGEARDIEVGAIEIGDLLLVRPGDIVPCDGVVMDGESQVDASRLTGEPIPISASLGTSLMSGSVNGNGALTMRAAARAEESQYAKIVELVRNAQASKAPIARLADRYAVWFTPATLAVCAITYFAFGDWTRVLAVLVVATPCPLILATPIAIIGGINRAARRQIIVRHGAALEALSSVDAAVFDKTGTLTVGKPAVRHVIAAPGVSETELLRLAGAAEVGSSHLLARTLVDEALARVHELPVARRHLESPGRGLSAEVDGHEVLVGARAFVLDHVAPDLAALAVLEREDSGLRAYVAIDGRIAGVVEYADRVRPHLPELLETLERLGVRRTMLLSGDHTPNVRAVAAEVGIREAKGDLLPEDKVAVVHQLTHEGSHVLMVGDGTNDAPALTAAHVGIALASHGGGISAEAADVVILADDLGRVAESIAIGRRTLFVARQSIWAGLGLSGIAMIFAAMGAFPPTIGALLQEVIDVVAIANALRASRA
jgi:heavy metal translocating P-type ATPase